MLRFLSVRHLAVIDHLEVEFEPGLNVLTGETGAGKTIVVEAIDLLVGGRASADLVRTGEPLATVQAIFETPDGRETIVRREVSAQGRSRAFIDDTLATTSALRQLGAMLLDLHGQHEHQTLLDPAEHLGLLDEFADHRAALDDLATHFEAWRAASASLERTRLDDREKRARIDMATFQLQEIEKVDPKDGEDDALAAERTVLGNADRLSRWSTEAYEALYAGEHAALAALSTTWKRVNELAVVDARFAAFAAQRDDITARLDDLALFLRSYGAMIDASPERLQAVEDRLAAIERLKRKYGPSLQEVLRARARLHDDLTALGATEERIAALQGEEVAARRQFLEEAGALSVRRRAAASSLARALEHDLAHLAMPRCRVDIRLTEQATPETWSRTGTDAVEFFFSPNQGEDVRPLARIASGGELSRVMLALRLLAAREEAPRTLIFDEVDAGIGGAAADAVGARLQRLGDRHQVLCVTHLAPIAARAGSQYSVSKQVRAGRTLTVVEKLDEAGREREVGRMIAGAAVSPQVLASAREMLARRSTGEQKAKDQAPARPAQSRGKRRGS